MWRNCALGSEVIWRGQSSYFARMFTFAPCATRTFTTSGWLVAAAHMSAVWPRKVSTAFTFACLAISSSATLGAPTLEASMSAV